MKKKVFVGFSGGVDSSISAFLLKERYDVTAVMFLNINQNPKEDKTIQRAEAVAKYLGIKLKLVDMSNEFKDMVINPFLESYKKGNTPNPCVNCNIHFKFGYFAQWCFKNGADYIATGHYCKTKNGKLYKGKDSKKDQSYFLHGISSEVLSKTIFPVGNMTKEKVRRIADHLGLPNSKQRDSQEVCFINTSLDQYLDTNIPNKHGDIKDIDTGEILGQHKGVHSLTLGQRKGIHIGGSQEPYFVAQKDISSNTIYVAKGKMHPSLWKDTFELEQIHTIIDKDFGKKHGLSAMIRYNAQPTPCKVDWDKNTVTLNEKVWTPSVGQSLVIYYKKQCLGGGKIVNIRQ